MTLQERQTTLLHDLFGLPVYPGNDKIKIILFDM